MAVRTFFRIGRPLESRTTQVRLGGATGTTSFSRVYIRSTTAGTAQYSPSESEMSTISVVGVSVQVLTLLQPVPPGVTGDRGTGGGGESAELSDSGETWRVFFLRVCMPVEVVACDPLGTGCSLAADGVGLAALLTASTSMSRYCRGRGFARVAGGSRGGVLPMGCSDATRAPVLKVGPCAAVTGDGFPCGAGIMVPA
jgi:hypothetical protein